MNSKLKAKQIIKLLVISWIFTAIVRVVEKIIADLWALVNESKKY